MTHVSNKKLGKEIFNKLFDQFIKSIEKAGKQGKFKYMAGELFTRTEKVMLAKRLAIIFLLAKEIPQHVITESLHVSPTTVSKLAMKIENNKYKATLNITGEYKKDILEQIEKFILIGMPPRYGRGHWKSWGRK